MARTQRQREPLKSGWVAKAVTVGPQNVPQVTVLQIPGIGAPMDASGTIRDAPSQWLSVWGGIRPTLDYNAATISGQTTVTTELGIVPYLANPQQQRAITRAPRPLWTPFDGGNATRVNILGSKSLVPWPVGALLVRVTFEWQMNNDLGIDVDICAAWAVCALPNYGSLPAIEDMRDL